MQGYWKASVNGQEVARGTTPEEAHNDAVSAGYDPNEIIIEFWYDQPRGPSIHGI